MLGMFLGIESLSFDQAWWLLLAPVAFLPFYSGMQSELHYSSLSILPKDRVSQLLDLFLKLLAALFLLSILLGLAGLHKPTTQEDRIGQGAQTVVLFDTSTSMDTPYSGNTSGGAAGRVKAWGTYESKGQVARTLIGKFVAKRTEDLFTIFAFSRNPIPIMPLTNNQDVIQAAIKAGTYERGLGTTNLGSGIIRALTFFEDKPFKGSRIIMLVSDGAAQLVNPIRQEISNLLRKHRVTLYWLYLRDRESLGLDSVVDEEDVADTAPEQLVNKFFEGIGTPYRAFSADDPKALEDAIAEVNKLQRLPIRYEETIPKQDLSSYCYGLALLLLLLLIIAKFSEIQKW